MVKIMTTKTIKKTRSFTDLTNVIWAMPKGLNKPFKLQSPKSNGRDANVKLGSLIYSFSTLISDRTWKFEQLDGSILEVQGSCSNCGECAHENENGRIACYFEKSIYSPKGKGVMKNHVKNTLGMRLTPEKVLNDLDRQITREEKKHGRGIYVRISQAGEVENEDQLFVWCMLAEKHPETKLYVYTKNFDFMINELEHGRVPSNLTILFSVWNDQGIKEFKRVQHLENVRAFVYVDGSFDYEENGLNIDSWCHAYGSDGKLNKSISCSACRACIDRKNKKVIGCSAH